MSLTNTTDTGQSADIAGVEQSDHGVPGLKKMAEGVWRLPLPMITESRHINSYLLKDGDYWCVVDCGNRGAPTRALWEAFFSSPIYNKGISRILMTHAHPDHSGSAAWLAKRTGAPVFIAEEELHAMNAFWRGTCEHEEALCEWLAGWGATGQQQEATVQFYRHFAKGCPEIRSQVHFLQPGDELQIGGRTWRLYDGRGHTPCNFLIYQPEQQMLITGDQVLPQIITNVSTWWGTEENPLASYMSSLERLKEIPVRLALPAHGDAFEHYQERCEQILAVQQKRLAKVEKVLAGGPKSMTELLAELVGKAVHSPLYLLIAGQVFARLSYLESTGKVIPAGRSEEGEPVYRLA